MVLAARPNEPTVVTSQPVRNGEADARTRPALKQNPALVARNYCQVSPGFRQCGCSGEDGVHNDRRDQDFCAAESIGHDTE